MVRTTISNSYSGAGATNAHSLRHHETLTATCHPVRDRSRRTLRGRCDPVELRKWGREQIALTGHLRAASGPRDCQFDADPGTDIDSVDTSMAKMAPLGR